VPGHYNDIDRELAAMGRTAADVRALVLTHGHSDHIGFAERLRRERAVPVSVHEADAALARGEVPNPAKGYGPVKLGPLLGFLWFTLVRGGLRTPSGSRSRPSATGQPWMSRAGGSGCEGRSCSCGGRAGPVRLQVSAGAGRRVRRTSAMSRVDSVTW
jgi:hypothetical protein